MFGWCSATPNIKYIPSHSIYFALCHSALCHLEVCHKGQELLIRHIIADNIIVVNYITTAQRGDNSIKILRFGLSPSPWMVSKCMVLPVMAIAIFWSRILPYFNCLLYTLIKKQSLSPSLSYSTWSDSEHVARFSTNGCHSITHNVWWILSCLSIIFSISWGC